MGLLGLCITRRPAFDVPDQNPVQSYPGFDGPGWMGSWLQWHPALFCFDVPGLTRTPPLSHPGDDGSVIDPP